MPFEQYIEKLFKMTPDVWERHANPWSVWTRYSAFSLLILAIWSRAWIGIWCLVPIAIAVLWIWFNPRVFNRPASTNNWASKAVLGERVWLNRKQVAIPGHHNRIILVLNTINGLGSILLFYGLFALNLSSTMLGLITVLLAKSWFLDRMVWLFDEMSKKYPPYSEWLY